MTDLPMGVRVRMSEALKAKLRGKCGIKGEHVGPYDPDDITDCWGCSSDHVEEFGDSVGLVMCKTDYGSVQGPEMDVRWYPSGFRYSYHPNDLEVVEDD